MLSFESRRAVSCISAWANSEWVEVIAHLLEQNLLRDNAG